MRSYFEARLSHALKGPHSERSEGAHGRREGAFYQFTRFLQVLRAGAVRATLPSAEMEQIVGAIIRLAVELT